MVMSIKQQIINVNRKLQLKEITIKNRKCYFLDEIINLKEFDSKLLKIDNISIYNIGYITTKKIDDYENIHSVNPLCLIIGEVDGFIEEKMEVNI